MEALVSVGQAAELIGVTRATVHNFVKRGKLQVKATLGKQEQIFLEKRDVLAFAEQYKKARAAYLPTDCHRTSVVGTTSHER